MLKQMGMYAYRRSDDRYGRGVSMRRLDCPICGHHVFMEDHIREQDASSNGLELWGYSCVLCTHVSTFRRQLEKMKDVTETN